MSEKSVLEKLQETNGAAEIWWDSSPLVYGNWAKGVVEKAPPEKKEVWKRQLKRLFDPENPKETQFRGVTTNPPLSLAAVKDNPGFWSDYVKNLIRENPGKGVEEIFWMTYKEDCRKRGTVFHCLSGRNRSISMGICRVRWTPGTAIMPIGC